MQAAVAGGAGRGRANRSTTSSVLSCHLTGVSGAPKLKDVAEWTPRLPKGMDAFWKSMVDGVNTMPPNGTCMTCTEDELHAAITFMSKP